MSALILRVRTRGADPAWRTTLAAGLVLLVALGLALRDGSGARLPGAAVGVAGIVLVLVALVPGLTTALRGPQAGAILLAIALAPVLAAVLAGVWAIGGGARAAGCAAAGVSLLAGLALLGHELHLRTAREGSRAERTPWQQLTLAGRARALPWRGAVGVALIAWAGGLALVLIRLSLGSAWALAAGIVLLGALVVLVGVPVGVSALATQDRRRLAQAREDERGEVAAHLHDSVLQTLALIQRQSSDPAAVVRLARAQERSLRSWMAGVPEPDAASLAGAIHAVVEGVEAEAGADVEVTVLGDRALDASGRAMAAAAREALRNAVTHGGGKRVVVFAELGVHAASTWIRDDGPGFRLEDVAPERRGVRDAILGRMAVAGGTASIDSEAGAGTEVVLGISGTATP